MAGGELVSRWYMGCHLERSTLPGYHLPWSTYNGETFLYADTLAGLKQLVKDSKKK